MVLSYSTYLGGPNSQYADEVAVDSSGAAYIAGRAYSGFPLVNPVQSYGGQGDAFVAKLSPDGQTLVYATYLGGSYFDAAGGIAVDQSGAAYVTGVSESWNFPTTSGTFQPQNSYACMGDEACAEAFVTKLSPSGSALVYSTFLGAPGADKAGGIAVDTAGNAYVSGITNATRFPVKNAVQSKYAGGGCNQGSYYYPCFDAFVTKLNSAGSALVYSTYLGGDRDEGLYFAELGGIAIDPAGHAYVTGHTESLNFPTFHAIQRAYNGGPIDSYVTKLKPDGSAFVYSTYLGGNNGEYGLGIAADRAGNAYVTGLTSSADFPSTPGSFQPMKDGNIDAFVSKLNPDGSTFEFSTFLGGDKYDAAGSVGLDNANNVYVSGYTASADFPIKQPFQATYAAGPGDAFVSKLSATGAALRYSSFLGGTDADGASGIAVDRTGNAYVVGVTYSTDFPTARPFQPNKAGYDDAFVTKISRTAVAKARPVAI
jgi:hypothetical protein